MRRNARWLLGLLTLLATPIGIASFNHYQDLTRHFWSGPEIPRIELRALAYGAEWVPTLGIVVSLIVLVAAPGWWRLAGLPGLLLNALWLLALIVFAPPHGGWYPY